MNLAKAIKDKGLELGFDLVCVTDAAPLEAAQSELLAAWLQKGHAAQMGYMYKNVEKRTNPAKLLANAQSVICLGLNYTPPANKKTERPAKPTGKVAGYAQYEDYHPFIKKLLGRLVRCISSFSPVDFKFKICVDSVPLAERALAARAGLGFIGKNHMLINPHLGPQIFLGEIITTLPLEADQPVGDNCGGCDKCIKACPTGALSSGDCFDANKCISYLTIEHKDKIGSDLAAKIGDRLFGCDRCVEVCPYQKKAPSYGNKHFNFYRHRAGIDLYRLLSLSEDDFEIEFSDSPIRRAGLEKLKANAKICLKNLTRRNRNQKQ